MAELLLELFSEEIPARMQARAREDLARLLGDKLKAAGLEFERVKCVRKPGRTPPASEAFGIGESGEYVVDGSRELAGGVECGHDIPLNSSRDCKKSGKRSFQWFNGIVNLLRTPSRGGSE